MSTKKTLIILLAVAVVGFGYYTISPIFKKVKLNEELPVNSNPTIEISEEDKTEDKKEDGPITISVNNVVDTPVHPASGIVKVIEVDGKKYIRYENYKTINGPDLYVYLSKDLDAKEFVNLGEIKGTEGNINYEIPENVNVSDYQYVLTWCKAFGVLFNSAKIK